VELAAPDLAQPVLGYRRWLLVGEELVSPLTHVVWDASPMHARCLGPWRRVGSGWQRMPPHPGPAPEHDCACGIYGFHRPTGRCDPAALGLVPGAIALWGRMEVHRDGMRGELARVLALAPPTLASARRRGELRRAAARLGVELVAPRHLEAAARERAAPLPASLLPG